MVKVTSPAVTQTDKEKCLAAVQKREDVTLPSPSAQQMSAVDQKPVITVTEESAKIKSETDLSMPEKKTPVGHENEKKVEIKIEQEENMEVETSVTDENFKSVKVDKMEVDTGASIDKNVKSEMTVSETDNGKISENQNQPVVQSETSVTGSVAVSNVEREKSSVNDSDTICETKVQIQVSVASETDKAGVTVPATVAQTDVTKPLTIETKFTSGTPNVSPGWFL